MSQELDLLDRKILYELDLNSRLSISTLAKNVRASKETVNFRLKRLVKNEYIKGFVTTLYTSNLNKFYYKLFYKFHKTTPKIDNEIISFINKDAKTAWFGTFEGPYDLAFLLISKSIYDLDNFLIEFRKLYGDYILEQEIHTLVSVHRFNLKFFYQSKRRLHTQYPKTLRETKIDDIDKFIIKEMANNSRIHVLSLAQKLKVDSGTVIHRIKKLKEKKILGTHTLALNFDKFKMQHFQINFKLRNNDSVNKLINFFSNHNNATFATVTLGKYDLAIELVVENIQDLKSILDSIKEHYSNEILDYDTFLITKEYNVTWYPEGAED
ncbi:AsnC family transcriptional regulator [Candidatus Woesearchaeota archaeon]|nr:AsnC family transcriptional regulator [Candidatus Woesearchaeota archaeon]